MPMEKTACLKYFFPESCDILTHSMLFWHIFLCLSQEMSSQTIIKNEFMHYIMHFCHFGHFSHHVEQRENIQQTLYLFN